MISIDYTSRQPITAQIRDQMVRLITSGALKPGDWLPSVRQLATDLSINPNTIQRAYAELERRGVIYAAKGRGNFISDDIASLRARRLDEIGAEIGALAGRARTLGATEEQLCGWLGTKGEDRE